MAAGLLSAVPAFAQSQSGSGQGAPPQGIWGGRHGAIMQQAVVGSVTAISGDTITLQSKGFGKAATSTTTYSVDATNAKVMKNGATSTVSAIAVNDMLMVQGTVNGTTVTATRINDGMPKGMGPEGGPIGGKGQGALAGIQGNGEPVIGGSVNAISGDVLTVTNKSNVTYSVDATNAKIVKNNATSSLVDIMTGDNVIVQGTVNGNTVTATTVIDQGTQPALNGGNGDDNGGPGMMHGFGGVMGAIGGFFQHLFGFF
jgi:hypothetical protein